MTNDKDFKKVVRDRAAKTGESYSTARSHLTGGTDSGLIVVRDQLGSSIEQFWGMFRPELKGLTNEEYLWEPVPGCITIRQGEDGKYRPDRDQFPVRGAASIAGRLGWAAQLLLVDVNQHFGDKSVTWNEVEDVPGDATGGVAFLESAVVGWREAIRACDPSFLLAHSENRSPGAIDGAFPMVTVITFKFQLLVQCAAQVSMTRDLYVQAHPDIVGTR